MVWRDKAIKKKAVVLCITDEIKSERKYKWRFCKIWNTVEKEGDLVPL